MRLSVLLSSLLGGCLAGLLPAVDLEQLERPGGLALIAGDNAGQLAIELAGDGHWLVRVVAADEAQAAAIRQTTQAWTPLVTVSVAASDLPFTTDSVNAMILADGHHLDETEARRVLAPYGELLTSAGHEAIPADPDYGSWPHFKGRADGQGISSDRHVAPSNELRWFAQSLPSNRLVSDGGVLGITTQSQPLPKDARKRRETVGMHGRDAFSGVLLWNTSEVTDPQRSHNLYAAHELGIIHAQAEEMSPVVLRDRYTGEVLVSYDAGLRMVGRWGDREQVFGPPTGSRKDHDISNGFLLVVGDVLVQLYGMQVAALDIASGELLWQQALAGPAVKLTASLDSQRVYLVETTTPRKGHGRWGDFRASAITALSLTDGGQLWRQDWSGERTLVHGESVINAPSVTDIFELDDLLYIADGSANLHMDGHSDLWALDPATGATIWHLEDANNKTKRREYKKHGPMTNNYIAWNGALVSKHASYPAQMSADAAGVTLVGERDGGGLLFTGAEGNRSRNQYRFLGGNQRCVRLSGTDDYLVYGFNSWVDREGRSYQVSLTRGNCAMPNYPTYGAVISVFDETCSCYNGLRGSAALVPAQELVIVPDDQRLSVPSNAAVVANAELPNSVLLQDMIQFPSTRFYYQQNELSGSVNGLDLNIDVQRHLITASGSASWQFRTDGRVYSIPVVTDDAVYIASTAGTVTCLDRATGAPRWRFFAAPARDEIVVNGQLESRWPVLNVIEQDGVIYAAAGRHAELNGGGWFWALDAASGAVQQRFQMFLPMVVAEPGNTDRSLGFRGNRHWASNTILITGLAVDETGKICLVHRKWNKSGSRPTRRGYWQDLSERTGDRADNGNLDPERPNARLLELDFAGWNGTVVNPHSAFFARYFDR